MATYRLDYHTSEDIVQDAFCNLIRTNPQADILQPGAYAWRSVDNARKDYFNKLYRRPIPSSIQDVEDMSVDDTLADDFDSRDKLQKTIDLLFLLGASGETLLLWAMGYSHKDLAEANNNTVPGTKALVWRARQHLKRRFEQ